MKISTLIDTNVLIDVWGPRNEMTEWSRAALVNSHREGALVINTIVWSELAPLIREEGALEAVCAALDIVRETLPWSAGFVAGLAHSRYRRAGGVRERTLPDFFIGAHAAASGYRLLSRDPMKYRHYFPSVELISPETHP